MSSTISCTSQVLAQVSTKSKVKRENWKRQKQPGMSNLHTSSDWNLPVWKQKLQTEKMYQWSEANQTQPKKLFPLSKHQHSCTILAHCKGISESSPCLLNSLNLVRSLPAIFLIEQSDIFFTWGINSSSSCLAASKSMTEDKTESSPSSPPTLTSSEPANSAKELFCCFCCFFLSDAEGFGVLILKK